MRWDTFDDGRHASGQHMPAWNSSAPEDAPARDDRVRGLERGARRWCAVGAHSPALWKTAGETADGAFDDAEDFAAHDVIATAASAEGAAALTAQPLWIDAGEEDPFLPGDEAFVDALHAAGETNVQLDTKPGGHDGGYWASRWKEYLTFYADALADC